MLSGSQDAATQWYLFSLNFTNDTVMTFPDEKQQIKVILLFPKKKKKKKLGNNFYIVRSANCIYFFHSFYLTESFSHPKIGIYLYLLRVNL